MIKFQLEADLSSLFTWNTKEVFVYVTAEWPSPGPNTNNQTDKAVIWDTIITSPSSDHLANIGPASLKKLRKSAAGKPIDPKRFVMSCLFCCWIELREVVANVDKLQRHPPSQEPEAKVPNHPPDRPDRRDQGCGPQVTLQCAAVGWPPDLEHGYGHWPMEEVQEWRERQVRVACYQEEGGSWQWQQEAIELERWTIDSRQ